MRGKQTVPRIAPWAGFMDLLEEKLASDGFAKLQQEVPKRVSAAFIVTRGLIDDDP
jgi:hypothetical protein